jgi:phospholipid/cholesterol/gamma-HCH transport system substrate-binding protein
MRRRSLVAILAVASLALSGCGFKGLYSAPLPGGADLGNHPFTVTAQFSDVLDLVPQSAVKVNDIAVGKVTAITLQGWHAKVTMSVNDSVHLPANARAEVAQTSLLGEKYVSLEQPLGAASSAPLKNDSLIKLASTNSAPEVEEVLGALSLLLNQGGLEQIQVIAHELNNALSGNESAIRDMIGQLNTFVGTLDRQKSKITTALDSINELAATLNRQKTVLTEALDTYPAALKVLSDERGNLVKLLTSLSHLGTVATGVIDATQTNLVSSLKSLHPALTALTSAGDNFPKALRILGTFPFPLGTSRQFVRGDYANLKAIINLNLSDTLCGVLGNTIKALCTTPLPILGASSNAKNAKTNSAGSKQIASTSAKKTALPTANSITMTPILIGSGK